MLLARMRSTVGVECVQSRHQIALKSKQRLEARSACLIVSVSHHHICLPGRLCAQLDLLQIHLLLFSLICAQMARSCMLVPLCLLLVPRLPSRYGNTTMHAHPSCLPTHPSPPSPHPIQKEAQSRSAASSGRARQRAQ